MSVVLDQPSRWARLGVEVFWIGAISFLTLVDAVGFNQNMQLLLKDSTDRIVWVVVLGCSGAAVLLPWSFGVALSSRRRSEGSGLAVAVPSMVLWLALAAAMFVVRLTTSPISSASSAGSGFEDPFATAPSSTATWQDADRLWVAVFLLVVVSVTFLTASKHAYDVSERRAVTSLRDQRDRLRRQLRRERESSIEEDHLADATRADHERLEQAQRIEEELVDALATVSREQKIEEISRNLGDPGATEILLAEYQRTEGETP